MLGAGYGFRMDIEPERWDHIQSHVDVPDHKAPAAVVLSVAALIGDADISASWPRWEIGGATRWTCWVVTRTSLGYVRVEYQRDWYDQAIDKTNPVLPSLQTGWVRRLADTVRVDYGRFFRHEGQEVKYLPLDPIIITFPEGQLAVPDHFVVLSARDAEPADELFRSIRIAIGF